MSFGSASSAGGPAAAPAASSAAGAPARVSGAGPETTGASDLSGEAATAAGASAPPVPAAAAGASGSPIQRPAAAASALPDRAGPTLGQPQPSPATVVAPLINGSGKAIASGDAGSAPADQQANLDGAASTSGAPRGRSSRSACSPWAWPCSGSAASRVAPATADPGAFSDALRPRRGAVSRGPAGTLESCPPNA